MLSTSSGESRLTCFPLQCAQWGRKIDAVQPFSIDCNDESLLYTIISASAMQFSPLDLFDFFLLASRVMLIWEREQRRRCFMVHSKIFCYNPLKYDKNEGFVKASDTFCFDMPNLDLLSGCHRRRSPLFLKNSFGKKKTLIFFPTHREYKICWRRRYLFLARL